MKIQLLNSSKIFNKKTKALPTFGASSLSKKDSKNILTVTSHVLNRRTKEVITPFATVTTKGNRNFIELQANKTILGQAEYLFTLFASCYPKTLGENYKEGLLIVKLSSFVGDKIRGIGTAIVDLLLKDSFEKGFNGKLALTAFNDQGKRVYCNKDGKHPSPVEFYKNYGFEFVSQSQTADFQQSLDLKKQLGIEMPNIHYQMYLPQQTALAKRSSLD